MAYKGLSIIFFWRRGQCADAQEMAGVEGVKYVERDLLEAHRLAMTEIHYAGCFGFGQRANRVHLVVEMVVLAQLLAGRHVERWSIQQGVINLAEKHESARFAATEQGMHPHVKYLAVGRARFDILAERGLALDEGIFVVDHFFHDRSEGHHAHAELACACYDVFWKKVIHLGMVVGRQFWVEQSCRDENGGVSAGIGFEEPRNLGG